MAPVLFYLGSVPILGYWLLTMVGLAAAHGYLAFSNRRSKDRIAFAHIHNLSCLAIVSIFLGGMLMGALVRLPYFLENWEAVKGNLLQEATSHRAFFGGAILTGCSLWWYVRRYGLDGQYIIRLFVPACALFMVFGRLACFHAGCCYGIPVSWGVIFPPSSLAPAGIPLFPSQLAEASGHLLLFVLLHFVKRKLLFYAAGYSILRFILEFFRGDAARGVLLGLSTSQWISLGILVCIVVSVRKKRI